MNSTPSEWIDPTHPDWWTLGHNISLPVRDAAWRRWEVDPLPPGKRCPICRKDAANCIIKRRGQDSRYLRASLPGWKFKLTRIATGIYETPDGHRIEKTVQGNRTAWKLTFLEDTTSSYYPTKEAATEAAKSFPWFLPGIEEPEPLPREQMPVIATAMRFANQIPGWVGFQTPPPGLDAPPVYAQNRPDVDPEHGGIMTDGRPVRHHHPEDGSTPEGATNVTKSHFLYNGHWYKRVDFHSIGLKGIDGEGTAAHLGRSRDSGVDGDGDHYGTNNSQPHEHRQIGKYAFLASTRVIKDQRHLTKLRLSDTNGKTTRRSAKSLFIHLMQEHSRSADEANVIVGLLSDLREQLQDEPLDRILSNSNSSLAQLIDKYDPKHPHSEKGTGLADRLGMHPLSADRMLNTDWKYVFFIAEGLLKEAAALTYIIENDLPAITVHVASVTLWGDPIIGDFVRIYCDDKTVVICPDGDWFQKDEVASQMLMLKDHLQQEAVKGNVVTEVLIAAPPVDLTTDGNFEAWNPIKQKLDQTKGLDDYLAWDRESQGKGHLADLEIVDRKKPDVEAIEEWMRANRPKGAWATTTKQDALLFSLIVRYCGSWFNTLTISSSKITRLMGWKSTDKQKALDALRRLERYGLISVITDPDDRDALTTVWINDDQPFKPENAAPLLLCHYCPDLQTQTKDKI